MKIVYKKLTYMEIEQFNKYSISMKKLHKDLQESLESGNIILEQYTKRKLEIIEYIRIIQKEQEIKILNYYCQANSKYSFIETLDGKKYIYKKYEKELITDCTWVAK